MPTFEHKLAKLLVSAQALSIHTDFVISLAETSVPCHKAIVSQYSTAVLSLIQNNHDSFEVDEDDDISSRDLILLVHYFYGASLQLSQDKALSLYLISRSLSCQNFSSLSKKALSNWTSQVIQNPIVNILHNLVTDGFKDHDLVFNDFSLKIHKFLFASISPYFETKFSRKWQESEENITDFTGLLKVEPSSFSSFFNSFYNGKLEVSLENAFDFSHLSWYFKLSELEKFCNNYILESKAEYSWVTSSVLKAINCEDYRFIKIISTKISEIPDLSNCDPIPVHPLFFQHLTANIDVSWLLKCLVYSYSNYSEDNIWTPESLKKSFETVKFETLSVIQLYEFIEPLLSISELFEYISEFSLSLFNKFTSTVPLNWFTWFIVESDLRKEFNLFSQVSPLLNEIITPENISQVPITSFNSETLILFASSSKKEHLVIWMINCLIQLWSSSKVDVEKFSTILMAFDLTETSFDSVYSALSLLFSDNVVRFIVYEFISTRVYPGFAHYHSETVRSLNSRLELTTKKVDQQSILLNLPEVQQVIKLHHETRSAKLKMKNVKFNGRRVDNQVKFLSNATTKTNTQISTDGLIATKAKGGTSCEHSFVAIQHPLQGTIVLTLRNFSTDFDSYIGYFDCNLLQHKTSYRHSHVLHVYHGFTKFRVNWNKNSDVKTEGISIGQRVVVTFDVQRTTISLPHCGYSISFTVPVNHVFGISMFYPGVSWSITESQ
ncbi:hypothetical protein RCL1_000183 [Eukaryota sp. TZLM3-RCL]